MEIRNFCIIAHVDHGKSTLADRFLELTGTVEKRAMREQYLDTMDLERERGITIKLQPVRMMWKGYQLNLIDTPGHTDFRYEVSRSLAAVEGAILLVDASQGIQAQTLATLHAALEQKLTVISALNKIDLPTADIPRVTREVVKLLGCKPEDVLAISAKDGRGVEELLQAIIEGIPPPDRSPGSPTSPKSPTVDWNSLDSSVSSVSSDSSASSSRALIFDAAMDSYRGVVAYVRVVTGEFVKGQRAYLLGSQKDITVTEVGRFSPSYVPESALCAGEIGYVVTGLKDTADARVGDTIASSPDLAPLPGYRVMEPMVFAGLYPTDADDVSKLRGALGKLRLNDAALTVDAENNAALGNGFRCGFLGLLHMDIVQERLEREHGCDLIVTAPGVTYEVVLKARRPAACVRSSLLKPDEPFDGAQGRPDVAVISNPADFPDRTFIAEIREPWVKLDVLCPVSSVGGVMRIVQERRGLQQSMEYLDDDLVLLHFEVPLQSIILDFFDMLKSLTSGYGSMSYEPKGFRAADLVKLDILLLGEPVDALSAIVHRPDAHAVGGAICRRLKEVVPRQQFAVPIQAAIGGKIVARETLPALRKDVTAKLYGGDRTRKDKLLKKQAKGKKRMKQMGNILLPQEAFLSVLQR